MRRSVLARLLAPVALLILASAVGASCGGSSTSNQTSSTPQGGSPAPTGAPILIGMVSPTSGTGAVTAQGQPIVAQAAIDIINTSGGVNGRPLKLVHLDDATDPQKTVTAYTSLVGQGVVAILGPQFSAGALAIKPISFDKKMPTLTWGSNTTIGQAPQNDYIFQMIENSDAFVGRLFIYIQQNLPNVKKIAILADGSAYGQGAVDAAGRLASQYGLQIGDTESYQLADTDMTVQLAKIKASNPDALFVWGFGPSMAIAEGNVHELGFNIPIFAPPGAAEPANLQAAGASAEGIMFVSGVCADQPLPGPQTDLIAIWKRLSPDPFLATFPYPWDAVNILAKALKTVLDQGGDIKNGDTVVKALIQATTGGYQGAEGVIDWSTSHAGPPAKGALICVIKNGQQQVLSGRVGTTTPTVSP